MIIKRIKYYIVFIIMFFSFVNIAYAGLEITEIMYDPEGSDTNREWVKLYNNGTEEINIIGGGTNSAWRISGGESKESLHYINEDLNIGIGEYAVITKNKDTFEKEYSSFSGSVTTASISFNNTAGIIKIWDGSNPRKIVVSKEYNSNNDFSDNSLDNNTDNPVDETVDPIPVNNNTPVVYKIVTKIISPKIVTAGVPFSIDHTTTGINKEKVILGKFVWNFGDGMSKSSATSDAFNYVYDYPGDYVITLSYFDSTFDTKPDATDRLTIKVIPSGINISSVGTYTDPFVELENKSSYEMSISGWILKGRVRTFMIPEGTVILSNKKLKLSPKITGFDFNDLSSISIIDTSGQVFATYPNIIKPVVKYSTNKNEVMNIVKGDIVESSQIDNIANSPDVINLNDLGASVDGADNGLNNKKLIYLGLAGIIIIGIVSVVLIRRKVDYPDYMEKEITANDMKIIE